MSHDHCQKKSEENKPLKIGRKLKIYGLLFVFIFAVSFIPIPVLTSLNESLIEFLRLIWWAILLGFVIGGFIDHFIPRGFIYKLLGQKRARSLLYAIVAGFLMSACSHGMLAIAIQLYKKGARIPSVITFLLASPWANLPITILLFSFFGWKAMFFVVGAIVVAIITGLVYMVLEKYNLIEKSLDLNIDQEYTWDNLKNFDFKKSARGVLAGSVSLANMVLWWIIIGVMLGAIIGAYVPGHIFVDYFGPTLSGLLLTLVFATIVEVCSEGSAPIALEIFKKTATLGNPFVFLMAGVATDYTEIGLIWTNIGKKSAIWLPVITVPQIVILGYLFNLYL